LISGQDRALDYKVSIAEDKSDSTTIETIDRRGREQNNPLFFGNMGDGEKKRFKKNPNNFKLTIFTFNKLLKIEIEKYFEAFLANTNFGTRQSKGFGNFYLTKPFDKTLIPHKVYSFSSTPNSWQKDIKEFYSFLRAGINTANYRGIYAKAVIFAYSQTKNITWDKKAIKNFYLDGNPNIPNEKLMRDLFGLSSSQNWMSYHAEVTKEDPTKEITRFKSPITFKPFKENNNTMKIYFWADESVEDILNKEFIINFNREEGLTLKTPNRFSFDEFFEFAFNLDLSKYIASEYHDNKQYTKLVRIFKEIKESN